MLRNLHIKNLALIHEVDVDFAEGLNILTGETGAGKSIIIDSIGMGLGGKVLRTLSGTAGEESLIELVFEVDRPETISGLRALEIEPEDGLVIISRRIKNGRGASRINGVTRTAQEVRECASCLIDIHGQSEHQKLLRNDRQLALIDEYGGSRIEKLKEEVAGLYRNYRELKTLLGKESSGEERARRISFLQYEIGEIDDASLAIGEDDELEETYKKLSNSKRIVETLDEVHAMTGYDERDAAGEVIGRALKRLGMISEYDRALEDYAEQLTEIDGLLNDFNRGIAEYMSDLTFEQESFSEVEDRLNLINHLKTKYGSTIEKIMKYREEKASELEELEQYEEIREERRRELKKVTDKLRAASDRLTEARKQSAARFTEGALRELKELNFARVDFAIEFEKTPDFTAGGQDEVNFMISTNPGAPRGILSQVVSGGELSRIMLGIKTMFAETDTTDTLIFDEVDSGISGRTAQKVAEKMAKVAKHHQVLCITHLPQIAAMADTHYGITKELTDEEAITRIEALDEYESMEELARILGGAEITENTLKSAREMKEMCRQYKMNVL